MQQLKKQSNNLEIISKENLTYKELRSYSRGKGDFIFIEGKKLFLEVLNSFIKIEKVFIDKKNEKLFSTYFSKNNNFELVFIKNNLLSTLYTTDSIPSSDDLIIALAKRPSWGLYEFFKEKKNLIFLEEIQDPGNLGTIVRSVLAFNSGGVLLSKGSVDPFNTKVIRASAGAVFKVPVMCISDFNELSPQLKNKKYNIIATSSKKGKSISELEFNKPFLFLFGNESKGLSEKLFVSADEIITIPHLNILESLNLGTTVSIFLWESYKRLVLDKSF